MPLLALYREAVRRRYDVESGADEIHRVRCADGVMVSLKRFRPVGTPTGRLPVLCIPGLGADSTNFDAPAPYGLGPWLASQGFDTWAIDLRGTGLSKLPMRTWMEVSFDDYVGLDLPAAIDHVCATAGVPRVALVGHSMGGLVIYASLASGRGARIAAGITIGSPLGFPQGWEVAPFLRPLLPLSSLAPGLLVGEISRLLTPLAMRVELPILSRWLKLDNMDRSFARRLMYRAVQDVPRGLMLQFMEWIESDQFRAVDGALDYRAGLHGCRSPVLVVGAPGDGLARLDSVHRAVELMPNATFLLAGRAGGMSTDYGHVDVVFGLHAYKEVFPHLGSFLEREARAGRRNLVAVS